MYNVLEPAGEDRRCFAVEVGDAIWPLSNSWLAARWRQLGGKLYYMDGLEDAVAMGVDFCWICGGLVVLLHCKIVCQSCGFTRD